MRWYQKAGILFAVAATAAVSTLMTHALLYVPFSPVQVCTGEENFAAAQYVNSNCYVSLFNSEGHRIRRYRTGIQKQEVLKELCYSNGNYYAWMEENDQQELRVYTVGNKKEAVPVLNFSEDSNLCGMHVHDNIFSVISWKRQEDHTELSVYLAGKDNPIFSESAHFVLPLCTVRNAFYTSADTVIYLTAEGEVFELACYEETPAPVLLYQDTEEIFMNMHDELCSLQSRGRLFSGKTALFEKELKQYDLNLFSCMDIEILENTYGAFLYQDADQKIHTLFCKNEMTVDQSEVSFFGRWLFVLVFVLILAVVAFCTALLGYAFWFASQRNAGLLFRTRLVCVTATVLINIIILYGSCRLYMNQQNRQEWEQMAIIANNMVLYLEQNTEVLSELSFLPEYRTNELWENYPSFQKLWDYTENIALRGEICTLFVPDAKGNLTAVSGKANQLFRSPEQCLSLGVESGYGLYQVDGMQWQYFSVPISLEETGSSALLVMQKETESRAMDIFSGISAGVPLIVGMTGFIILLLMMLRRSIRPLSEMEQQAHTFMLKGDCDLITVKGHTEIALLASNFRQNVEKLRINIHQQQENQESFGKFVDEKWPVLFGKRNLSALHPGDTAILPATVLYMKIVPKENDNIGRKKIYQKILPVIRQHNGICETLSMEHMRFVFTESSFDAICCASVIREILSERCELTAVIHYSVMHFCVMGDETHKRFCTWHPEESRILPKMVQVCQEYGCQILVTDYAMQNTLNFESIFNSRTIGFFQIDTENKPAHIIRLTEILSQQCADEFEQAVMLYQTENYKYAFELFCAAMRKDSSDRAAAHYLRLCYQNLYKEKEHETT